MGARCCLVAVVLSATLASGCSLLPEPSRGERGRVEYAWSGGLSCLFGCDASAPLAVEGHAGLSLVDADLLPPFTVSSDDPSVALFTRPDAGSNGVLAEGVSPGRARAVLRDARTGEVIDRLPIRVAHVDRIASFPELPEPPLTMMTGAVHRLSFRLFEGDREMVGVGAVDYELTSPMGVHGGSGFLGLERIGEAIDAIFGGASQESVDLEALEPGEGRVRVVAASGAALEIPYSVVAEEAITRIVLDVEYAGSIARVDALVWAGDRPAEGARCAWSISPDGGPLELHDSTGDSIHVGNRGPGSASVTCAIGSVSESVAVRF